ncbi:MAG: TRAP transporter large permease subunit, partial [Desulfobacterium sp.]
IVIAAMLGSLLLYASMVIRVHYTAKRENLSGVTESDIISYKQLLRDSYLLIPMVFLVVMLLRGYSPFLAANAAIGVTFLISFLKKETRMTPARLWKTLSLSGRNMIMIALACAGAGMVVAIVTHTGLALGIATVITNWSGGHMLPAMLLIMFTSLVMGMGLPCTPAYIIAITIGGPALLAMGADMLSAHLFVYYFAVLAGVTPPVCVPAFCAASIAGSKPLQTGFEAFKLSLAGFLIPYVFVFNPALLMRGTVLEIITVVLGLVVAIIFFAGALSGYFFKHLNMISKTGLLVLAGLTTFLCARPNVINTPLARIVIIMILAGIVFRPMWLKSRAAKGMKAGQNA